MKNLLTKTLFISLLSSVVTPSGVQANPVAEKFDDRVVLGAQVVLLAGLIAADTELKLGTEGVVEIGAVVGAGLGTMGGTVATLAGLSGLSKLAGLAGLSTMIEGGIVGKVVGGMKIMAMIIGITGGAAGGARVGAAIVRKIRKYFDLRTATDEII